MKLILENWQAFVNEEKNDKGKERGSDGEACWDDYKYAGTEDGKDNCVKMEEEFKPHTMYDPKTGKSEEANTHKRHLELKDKGWGHEKPDLEETKKKKACKPSKGKRFAKRVDGKCRSFGQKGQAKGGGDRIRPGTKKGDAYCARSAKIKKCKNPPCANALSRKKWKCRGSKSMKE